MQDDRRGRGVEQRLPAAPVAPGGGEPLVGFVTRQAFAFGVNRQRRARAQRFNESQDTGGCVGRRAIEARRKADDDPTETIVFLLKLTNARGNPCDRISGVGDRQRLEGTRESSRRVADRQTDAPIADVDAEHAHTQWYNFGLL